MPRRLSHRARRPARSFDLHQQLSTLLVCAVATVVFTRAFLAATGYPQVGGGSLHIAHVLYGGLLLTAAVITAIAFLSPAAKSTVAVLGGIGFGLFIDEVGKFVTKDVNYFYRPAIAIIYICFVALFAVIRRLARARFSAQEATLIGLESLQRAAVGTLSDERRVRVLHLLASTGTASPLAGEVRELLTRSATTETHPSPAQHRLPTPARSCSSPSGMPAIRWLRCATASTCRSSAFALNARAEAAERTRGSSRARMPP